MGEEKLSNVTTLDEQHMLRTQMRNILFNGTIHCYDYTAIMVHIRTQV